MGGHQKQNDRDKMPKMRDISTIHRRKGKGQLRDSIPPKTSCHTLITKLRLYPYDLHRYD